MVIGLLVEHGVKAMQPATFSHSVTWVSVLSSLDGFLMKGEN